MSDEKVIDTMKQEIRARMQSLALPTPKIASEFYTPEEMVNFSWNVLVVGDIPCRSRNNSKNQKR